MSDFTRCSSGRRVVRKNTQPGLARDNFSTAGLVSSGHPLPGEVAFFQDAQDAIDYVQMRDRIQAVRDLHREWPVYGSTEDCYAGNEAHDEARHFESVDGEWLCQDLYAYSVCSHCRDEEGFLDETWPCATIKAMEAVIGDES